MRIEPRHGVIESRQHLLLARACPRARAATRRHVPPDRERLLTWDIAAHEWKCTAAICHASRGHASRLHLRRGCFARLSSTQGRNRTTPWYAIVDGDWNGGLRDAYLHWLDPANFDAAGTAEAEACRAHGAVRSKNARELAGECWRGATSRVSPSRAPAHGLFDELPAVGAPFAAASCNLRARRRLPRPCRNAQQESLRTTFAAGRRSSTATAAGAHA